jgi:hypothetical protein
MPKDPSFFDEVFTTDKTNLLPADEYRKGDLIVSLIRDMWVPHRMLTYL